MAGEQGCLEQRRFERIENDIKEIKDNMKVNYTDIQNLKESQAEARVYVKQIFERMDDIKAMIKNGGKDSNDRWLRVVIELTKTIGVVAAIIAAIKLIG